MLVLQVSILDAFAESVNAVRSGDPERIATANREWYEVTGPRAPWTPADDFDGEPDDMFYELSNGEYDRIADEYERRLGL